MFVRERAFQHFGIGGGNAANRCKRAPRTVINKFREGGKVVPAAMSYEEVFGNNEVDHAVPMPIENDPDVVGTDGETEADVRDESSQPGSDSIESNAVQANQRRTHTPSSSRQRSMEEALQIGTRKQLDRKWASFLHEANIPFNVIRHPAFVSAVVETAKAGMVYQPPSYNFCRTKMVDYNQTAMKAQVAQRTNPSIQLYGATLCSDGWDNTTRRPLMNMMLVCPAGDVFLGSVDTTGKKKDKEYTATSMAKYIEEVGPRNIVQICTDNASVMLGAMRILERKYKHLYRQGCAAHILDLLLEDWGKSRWVKDLVERGK